MTTLQAHHHLGTKPSNHELSSGQGANTNHKMRVHEGSQRMLSILEQRYQKNPVDLGSKDEFFFLLLLSGELHRDQGY